jgi:hypothetical protein
MPKQRIKLGKTATLKLASLPGQCAALAQRFAAQSRTMKPRKEHGDASHRFFYSQHQPHASSIDPSSTLS